MLEFLWKKWKSLRLFRPGRYYVYIVCSLYLCVRSLEENGLLFMVPDS